MPREVTERDFRMPEFRDAKVEDYEFREDGKVVRKDRWETGIRSIAAILGASRSFEIPDLVDAVRVLKGDWNKVYPEYEDEDYPSCDRIDVRLSCGTVLIGLRRHVPLKQAPRRYEYVWEKHGSVMRFDSGDFHALKVAEWRESVEQPAEESQA